MKDIIIAGRFRLDYKIGDGAYGQVYIGTDLSSRQQVAIKLEHISQPNALLVEEQIIYAALRGAPGMPQAIQLLTECDFDVLVLELLGPSLEDFFHYCDSRLSLKTVLLIADQAICRLQTIHKKGYLHRDIKPENFVMGSGKQGNVLYVIDFGCATDLTGPEVDWQAQDHRFVGTELFASLNTHQGFGPSWRDDLESLGYMLVYLLQGVLPWSLDEDETEDEGSEDSDSWRKRRVEGIKETTTPEELCRELPKQFATYFRYVRSLRIDQRPNYSYCRKLFQTAFHAKKYRYDNVFDWTKRRFQELSSRS